MIIIKDRKLAIVNHNKLVNKVNLDYYLIIYSNSSSFKNQIEAAAVIPAENIIYIVYIGLESISIVYTAELKGINMAIKLITEYINNLFRTIKEVTIFTNS